MTTVGVLLAAGLLAGCTSSGNGGPSTSAGPTSPAATSGASTPPATTSAAPEATTFAAVTGKATTLHFAPALVRALYTRGVSTAATGKARLVAVPGSSNAVLPITAGTASFSASPAATRLQLKHDSGGLNLKSDKGSVRVGDIVVRLGSTPTITARVVVTTGGTAKPVQTITLFDLVRTSSFKAVATKRAATVSGLRIYLSAAAGQLLNKALGATVVPPGTRVLAGTVTISLAAS